MNPQNPFSSICYSNIQLTLYDYEICVIFYSVEIFKNFLILYGHSKTLDILYQSKARSKTNTHNEKQIVVISRMQGKAKIHGTPIALY